MTDERRKKNNQRNEIRVGRAITALLKSGMSKKEVADLLGFRETDLVIWTTIGRRDLD